LNKWLHHKRLCFKLLLFNKILHEGEVNAILFLLL
jgi:hypothetical protein